MTTTQIISKDCHQSRSAIVFIVKGEMTSDLMKDILDFIIIDIDGLEGHQFENVAICKFYIFCTHIDTSEVLIHNQSQSMEREQMNWPKICFGSSIDFFLASKQIFINLTFFFW